MILLKKQDSNDKRVVYWSLTLYIEPNIYVVSVNFVFPFSAINLFDWNMWQHLIQRIALGIHPNFPFP